MFLQHIAIVGIASVILVAAPCVQADTFRVELDYMVQGGVLNPHSHMPQPDEIQEVVDMFACQGHTLIVDVSDALPHYETMVRDPANGNFFSYDGAAASFGNIKNTYFDHTTGGWHYGIFGHQYENDDFIPSGSSGLGEVGGDDFVVTLGTFTNQIGTPFTRAGTLAHEFGHNLGLGHCGTMYCGDDKTRPDYVGSRPCNVPSIMSYFYQILGVRNNLLCQGLSFDEAALFRNIDYSRGTMCSLNEAFLDESYGTGMIAVDWNCDGMTTGVSAQDLNGSRTDFCEGDGQMNMLDDYDEWSNIVDNAKHLTAKQLNEFPEVSCITSEEWNDARNKAPCPQANVTLEPCPVGDMIYLDPAANVSATGQCSDPYNSLASAQVGAPQSSVLFLEPATYNESGVVVLNKTMKLFSVGTVVIK